MVTTGCHFVRTPGGEAPRVVTRLLAPVGQSNPTHAELLGGTCVPLGDVVRPCFARHVAAYLRAEHSADERREAQAALDWLKQEQARRNTVARQNRAAATAFDGEPFTP